MKNIFKINGFKYKPGSIKNYGNKYLFKNKMQIASYAKKSIPLDKKKIVNSNLLTKKINTSVYYNHVANIDLVNKVKWEKMNKAMLSFSYLEEKTLKKYPLANSYSKDMRSTLHVYLRDKIVDVENMTEEKRQAYLKEGRLYDDYIAFHAQAFKQNGACTLSIKHPILSFKILLAPIYDETYTFNNVSIMLNAIKEGYKETSDDLIFKNQAIKAIKYLKENDLVGDIIEVKETDTSDLDEK